MKKPKTLEVSVVHASGCRVALYKGRVFAVEDGLGHCDKCPFDKYCKRQEKDVDTYTAPCAMCGLEEVHFVELLPGGNANK